MKKNVYIMYSGATRQTGEALKETLNIDGGVNLPSGNVNVVICYGAKTREDVSFGKAKVLNHANNIRKNRNKLSALGILKKNEVNVSPFVSSDGVFDALKKKKEKIKLPLVGRMNYHQGGKGFYLALTENMLKNAVNAGVEYFQNFIDIETEYRLHVFDGEVIYSQKKVQRENMVDAFVEQHADKVKQSATQSNKNIDVNTLEYVLQETGKRVLEKPDMIVRSNTRGWKFQALDTSKVNSDLKKLAIKAVEALDLDFGAVDCCKTTEGDYVVIEVNSGPGLDGSTLTAYIDKFTHKINKLLTPVVETSTKKAATETKMHTKSANKTNTKLTLKEKLKTLSDLLDGVENDDDLEVLSRLARKTFG